MALNKNLEFVGTLFKNVSLSESFVILHLPLPVIKSFLPSFSFFSIRVTLYLFENYK